jgi:hypothetical protein
MNPQREKLKEFLESIKRRLLTAYTDIQTKDYKSAQWGILRARWRVFNICIIFPVALFEWE